MAAVGLVTFVTGAMAWLHVRQESKIDLEDVERRALAVSHRTMPLARDMLLHTDRPITESERDQLDGYRSFLGFSIATTDGKVVAAARGISDLDAALFVPESESRTLQSVVTACIRLRDGTYHVLSSPISDSRGQLLGTLTAVHEISHLSQRSTLRLIAFGFWILVVGILLAALLTVGVRNAYERPLHLLADWMRRLRVYDAPDSPPTGLPNALLESESERLAASFRAARSQQLEELRAADRCDRVWTRERLRGHAIACFKKARIVAVSNREPYMHNHQEGKPKLMVPAGGLVTALDPILRACGGLWVAHGGGDADRETADSQGRLLVPPGEGSYTLRRLWMSRDEEQGYYYGFSNEGLWPLCHLAHERPVFRYQDWEQYVRINERFARIVLEEVDAEDAVVLVQDYQLALVPKLLKVERPDLRVGIFWHIPWPNPEAIRICPWRREILEGMLGADLVGFHLQQYCNNFLDSVDRMVEARLDWDHFSANIQRHTCNVRPFPISIENWSDRSVCHGEGLVNLISELKERHGLQNARIAVGVDRLDYTKGLAERFRAIDRLFEKFPAYRGLITFIQLGAPSRTHIPRYRELVSELETLAAQVNWRHRTESWKPIQFLVAHHDASTVQAFLRMADLCVVSPLHDGMNLVAKEYVSARENCRGVLILSEFAGAARELSDALIINPYDTEQFADALKCGLEMKECEQRVRMERMRRVVDEHNVYRWAGNFLSELAASRIESPSRNTFQGSAPAVQTSVPAVWQRSASA